MLLSLILPSGPDNDIILSRFLLARAGLHPLLYPLTSPWRWRQQGPQNRWYPTSSLHGVVTQKTMTWIYYRVNEKKPMDRTLSQMNLIRTFQLISQISFNMIFIYTLGLPKRYLPLTSFNKDFVRISCFRHVCYVMFMSSLLINHWKIKETETNLPQKFRNAMRT